VEELGAEAEAESIGTGVQAETQRRSVLSRIWRQLKVCAATGRPTTEVWSLLACHQFQMLPEDNKCLAASTDTDFSTGWLQDYRLQFGGTLLVLACTRVHNPVGAGSTFRIEG
jgi:hypothetical protein